MNPGIHVSGVWSDDDVVELRSLVSDGASSFSNQAYVGHAALEDAVSSLHVFKDHVSQTDMPIVTVSTEIKADPEVCFDLARSVEAHLASTAGTGERAAAGVTSGPLGLGDQVTWRARHLGVVQHLSSRITALNRPGHFRDEMVQGAFARLAHDHYRLDESGRANAFLRR